MTRTRRGNGEGCLYLRKDGRWSAIISLGAGLRKTYYRKTREEAILAFQQAQRAKMQGTLSSTREETVEIFLLNWLVYQIQPKVRERTYQTYQQVVKQDILPSLGNIALQKLTHWHLQRLYQQKRHQKATPSTIRKIHKREGSSGKLPEWVFCDCRGVPLRASNVVRQSFQPLRVAIQTASFPKNTSSYRR